WNSALTRSRDWPASGAWLINIPTPHFLRIRQQASIRAYKTTSLLNGLPVCEFVRDCDEVNTYIESCAMGSFGMTSPRAGDTSRLCSGSLGSVRLSLLWWSLVLLSFLAFLSSPTDAAVVARRRNMTNPAFQGAGTEAGLKIWRIE
ncbi:unnamed protein product, partial [Timema podura]|nr:unnamed protein product [Timema podura]